jgi:23S rRNA pseudouridine1911/1915/1917 synthase
MTISAQRGRAAKTDYHVLSSAGGLSLVECRLHSGRTHQIRVHLHHLGYPIAGDKVYGSRDSTKYPRQMLHAWKLAFRHPATSEWKRFEARVPEDFQQVMASAGLAVDGRMSSSRP